MGEAGILSHDERVERDVMLAIEVLDSRCDYESALKLPLYAKAGLQEVWFADPESKAMEVYTRPALRGYRDQQTFARGASIKPLAFPRLRFRVAELLG